MKSSAQARLAPQLRRAARTICCWVGTSSALTGSSHTSSLRLEDHGARDADALALARRRARADSARRAPRARPTRRSVAQHRRARAAARRAPGACTLRPSATISRAVRRGSRLAERILEDHLQLAAQRRAAARGASSASPLPQPH